MTHVNTSRGNTLFGHHSTRTPLQRSAKVSISRRTGVSGKPRTPNPLDHRRIQVSDSSEGRHLQDGGKDEERQASTCRQHPPLRFRSSSQLQVRGPSMETTKMTARSQLARLCTLQSRMSSWPNKHLPDFTGANSCACWLQAPRTTSPAKLTAVKHLLVASFTILPASSGGRQWNKPLHLCIIEVWNSAHCQRRATSANWLSCLARSAGGQVPYTAHRKFNL